MQTQTNVVKSCKKWDVSAPTKTYNVTTLMLFSLRCWSRKDFQETKRKLKLFGLSNWQLEKAYPFSRFYITRVMSGRIFVSFWDPKSRQGEYCIFPFQFTSMEHKSKTTTCIYHDRVNRENKYRLTGSLNCLLTCSITSFMPSSFPKIASSPNSSSIPNIRVICSQQIWNI